MTAYEWRLDGSLPAHMYTVLKMLTKGDEKFDFDGSSWQVERGKVLSCSTMKRIGVRELRQNASVWLRRVQAGESFEITDRGRPVAMLVPAPGQGIIERLIATGQMRPAVGKLTELASPLPARPGEPSLSSILDEMRADER